MPKATPPSNCCTLWASALCIPDLFPDLASCISSGSWNLWMKTKLVWPDDSCSFDLCELLASLNFIFFSHHQAEKDHLLLFYLAPSFLCVCMCVFSFPLLGRTPSFGWGIACPQWWWWWWWLGALPSLIQEGRACLPPVGSQVSSLSLLLIRLLLPTSSLKCLFMQISYYQIK